MPADYLHGVEQIFLPNNETPIKVLAASTIGMVATSADADASVFPLNTPVLVHSPSFIAKAGTNGTLRTALKDIYAQGGATIHVVRVSKEAIEADQIAAIIGTVDNETGTFTGMKALLSSQSKLGVKPRLIVVPEFSHKAGVGTAMESLANKLNAIAIVDGSETGFTAVKNEAAAFQNVYFVNAGIQKFDPDAVPPAMVTRSASATIAGHIVRVDNDEGYWHSPSNRKIFDLSGIRDEIDYSDGNANSLANLFNAQNVSTIVNKQGGYFLWGNRLCNGTLLPHQRIRFLIGDSIVAAHQDMVDRNVTKNYIEGVKNRVNKLIRRLKAREVINGGACWVDSEINQSSVGTGQVFWDYELGFFDVAERMTFRQSVTDSYNQALFA